MSVNSSTVTEGVQVEAAATYLPQESEPDSQRHVFAYRITITNVGAQGTVRLLSRHWHIVDAEGRGQEVRGRGVVGEFPKLAPGENYSYVSYCPLKTNWGTMEGEYTFEREDRSTFEVAVGRFFLVPEVPEMPLEPQSLR